MPGTRILANRPSSPIKPENRKAPIPFLTQDTPDIKLNRWGNILAEGRAFIFDAPWLFTVPGLAIFVVVLAFNLVGEGLREALNPKLRRVS